MSITVNDIINKLDALAPRAAACEWDNPGLLVGRSDQEVSKVYVALDASLDVVNAAIEEGCDLVVTHHPIIFHAIKSINDETGLGIKLLDLIHNDVAVYSMHTNFDSCPGGMGDLVCGRLGLKKLAPMEYTKAPMTPNDGNAASEKALAEEAPYGIGFIAELPHSMTAEELSLLVKEKFQLPFVQYYDAGSIIRKIACCPGSGRGELKTVLGHHVDAFLTGDMGHHEGLDYTEEGISLIDAGHYGLENVFTEYIADFIKGSFPEAEVLTAPLHFPAALV